MGGKIPEHIVSEIKDRVSIREVVEDYVRLQKDGANYKGLCPFHEEKTPSFKVHDEKGIYKCFGCGESGNVFGFLMKKEGMSFREAVERLAARAGVTIPRYEPGPDEKKMDEQRDRLLRANAEAAAYYRRTLLESEAGAPARKYLASRGIADETSARYQLGCAPPGWRDAFDALAGKKGIADKDLAAAGLIVANDKGGYYDRFRARLMFPIKDVQGRVIGFGGRLLQDDPNAPKYLNSPETLLFKKGSGFFGLNLAKDAIRKDGRVVVVEGYFDQIALDQAGVGGAVATLGTALTAEHARMLKRYAAEAFMVFDADAAGRRASLRSLEVLLEAGVSARIVLVPEGKDPDDFLRRHDRADFERLLDAAPLLISHYFDELLGAAPATPSGLAKAVGEAAEMIGRVRDSIERGKYAEMLARRAGVPVEDVQARVRRPDKKRAGGGSERAGGGPPPTAPAAADDDFSKAELDLIMILVHHPETAGRVRGSGAVAALSHQGLAQFLTRLLEREEKGEGIDPAADFQEISEPGLRDRVSRAILEDDPFAQSVERALEDVLNRILRDRLASRLTRLKREIASAQESGDEGRWRSLMREQQRLLAEQRQIGAAAEG